MITTIRMRLRQLRERAAALEGALADVPELRDEGGKDTETLVEQAAACLVRLGKLDKGFGKLDAELRDLVERLASPLFDGKADAGGKGGKRKGSRA